MQVSVESSGAIERKLTVSIPHAEVDQAIEKRLREVGRSARVPGFRPGKAPPHLIAKRYGGQVTNEVISDTINASYREALGRENLRPAGLVSLQPKPFVAGDDLQYVATVELFPPIPAPTLAGRTVEKPVCEITPADVDRALESIRKGHAEFVARGPGERAQDGDRLTIDSEARADGRKLDYGSAAEHPLILGEGRMMAAVETGLRGAAAGETQRIPVTFPADFLAAEVAGKAVELTVTVKRVERPVLPDLDDAFAEQLGLAGGLAKLRAEVETNLRRTAESRTRAMLRERVMEALLAANPIDTPQVLVEAEIEHRVQALSRDGRPPPDLDRETLRAGAARQVTLGLIVREVIDREGLKVDAEAVRQRITDMARREPGAQAEALVNWYYADPARLRSVESMALEEKVVERMLETATVAEKPLSFEALMQTAGQ